MSERVMLAALLFVTSQAAIWTVCWALIQRVNRWEAEKIVQILESADSRPEEQR